MYLSDFTIIFLCFDVVGCFIIHRFSQNVYSFEIHTHTHTKYDIKLN
jgi:hypothetical protein